MPIYWANCCKNSQRMALSTSHDHHSQSYPQKLWNRISAACGERNGRRRNDDNRPAHETSRYFKNERSG
jgi:hypothetical protein